MLCGLCLFDSLGLCWRHGNRGWLSSLVPSVIWYPTDVGEEELPQRKSSFYLFLIQLNCGENRRDRFPAAAGKVVLS